MEIWTLWLYKTSPFKLGTKFGNKDVMTTLSITITLLRAISCLQSTNINSKIKLDYGYLSPLNWMQAFSLSRRVILVIPMSDLLYSKNTKTIYNKITSTLIIMYQFSLFLLLY